jgi:hypothetical protein
VSALDVACPYCFAPPGKGCRTFDGRTPIPEVHESRLGAHSDSLAVDEDGLREPSIGTHRTVRRRPKTPVLRVGESRPLSPAARAAIAHSRKRAEDLREILGIVFAVLVSKGEETTMADILQATDEDEIDRDLVDDVLDFTIRELLADEGGTK